MAEDPFPLETERLLLRPPTPEDADDMAAIFGDMRVMRWLGRDAPETAERIADRIDRARAFQRELGYCIWLARLKAGGELVGDCGLVPAERTGPETEIAWRFAPNHWGRGYATEAATAALDFAFTRTDLDHVIAMTLPSNERSQRVAEKLGMRRRGIETFYGKAQSVYEIARAEWLERRGLSGSPPEGRSANRP